MKQERFEKVVKGDKDYLINAWVNGIFSLVLPLMALVYNELSFLDIVFVSFVNGMLFIIFAFSALEYAESRKVYWRKMK